MRSALLLALLIAALPAQAQLLKCIGKDGKVEYASQCPPGTKEQQTSIRNAPSTAKPTAPAQQPSLAEREADFRKRQMESAEAQKKQQATAAEKAEQSQACEQAKVYLKSIQEGQRIARVDPRTGERVFLEDADRPAEQARAQRAVDTNCK